MPDLDAETEERSREAPIGGDTASLQSVAEKIADPQPDTVVREYLDRDGRKVAPNESVSLARAARDYSGARKAEQLIAESQTSETLALRIDALRAEALAHYPGAAEFYGFEPLPKPSNSDGQVAETPEATRQANDGELAPELEKALEHPQVRQAIEEQLGEIERVRQDYVGGLAAATQIAQASFLNQFPELAKASPDQLPGMLEQMSRTDPARFAQVQALVSTGQQLVAEQEQQRLRHAQIAQSNFQDYANKEDARFETMLKGEAPDTQRAVAMEIAASARSSGIGAADLVRLFNSEPLMRNAAFQKMMYDAGKYRLMMKARDAAVTRPLPPVQRPGAARHRAEREHAELRTLSARLSSSGDIKDAVALYHARTRQK
jgi:hypothetical protein